MRKFKGYLLYLKTLMKQELKRTHIKRMRWRCMRKVLVQKLTIKKKKKVKTIYDLGISGSKRMGKGH